MAAPTKLCDVKILLANPEPSTHGTSATLGHGRVKSETRRITDIRTFAPGRI